MQGQLAPCFVQEKLTETHMMLQTDEQNVQTSQVDIYGMAELVAGYMDCMEEAVNYLKDVEHYSDDHPAIIGLQKHLAHYRQKFVNEAIQKATDESSRTMIPSLPEAISATHVEYLPLPPAYLRPIIDASRSRNPTEANNARAIPPEHFGQRVVTKEELAKIRALRAMQQFIPINISAVPRSVSISYFRGNDLRYAPHVRVPAAESVQNS